MRVELGWAFFVRMDGVLEHFVDSWRKDSKKTTLFRRDYLLEAMLKTGSFTEHELEGLKVYRDLRNALHHDDGQPIPEKRASLSIDPGREFHFLPKQMQLWRDLFLKVGRVTSEMPRPRSPEPRGQ